MLAKKYCLKGKANFEKVFKYGDKHFAAMFGLKILKNSLDYPRFGIIISGKISKKAVVRNKVRRRISEIFRLNLKNFRSGFDVIIICRQPIIKASYQDIEKEILSSAKKLKLTKVDKRPT
ncbi:ribonuclease P protein component [Candidatus Parcubacteria bacterium]|nr:ribonuclease P protein component [Candidatus Parcubacteria bacterium]